MSCNKYVIVILVVNFIQLIKVKTSTVESLFTGGLDLPGFRFTGATPFSPKRDYTHCGVRSLDLTWVSIYRGFSFPQ